MKFIYLTILLLAAAVSAESYNKKHTITYRHRNFTNNSNLGHLFYAQFTDTTSNNEIGSYVDLDLDNNFSAGVTYRKYPYSSGDHFFWGTRLGYRYNSYSSSIDSVSQKKYTSESNYIQTGFEIGWRWNWQCGFNLELGLPLDLEFGISNNSYKNNEFQLNTAIYLPAIRIGYMF